MSLNENAFLFDMTILAGSKKALDETEITSAQTQAPGEAFFMQNADFSGYEEVRSPKARKCDAFCITKSDILQKCG